MYVRIVSLFLFCLCTKASIFCQQSVQNFNKDINYLLYNPSLYDNDTNKYPLLIFLHGTGERGTDIEKVKTHGPPMLIEKGKHYPFIVVSPQSQTEWKADYISDLLEHLKKKLRIDEDKIYLTGIGYGPWDIAMAYPRIFAAIAPICGGGEHSRAWKLRHLPSWGFHGAKDDVVPLSASEDLVNEVKKYNKNAKLTIYPDVNHDSWVQSYENPKLYEWLLKQSKFEYKEKSIDESLLTKFAGEFKDINNSKNRLQIHLSDKNLYITTETGRQIKLIPFADESFYYEDRFTTELLFQLNKNGQVEGFTMMDNNKKEYLKIKK